MSKKQNKKKEKKMEAQMQPQNENTESAPLVEAEKETEQVLEIKKTLDLKEETLPQEQELIGDFLKRKREEKNLSIKVIARHTKISTTLLELLEDNNTEQLPDKAYVTGFVKSYAKTINIDQKEALEVLRRTYSDLSPEEVIFEAPEVQEAREIEDKKTNLIKVSGVALAVIAIIVAASMSSKDAPKEVVEVIQKEVVAKSLSEQSPIAKEIIQIKKVEAEPVALEVTAVTEAPIVEKKVVETVKNEAEKVTDTEKKKEAKKEIRFQPMPVPLYSMDVDMTQKQIDTYLPQKFQKSIITGKQNVFINAVDGDSWITYKSDANPVKKFVLKQGRTLLIRGDLNRVFLGNVNVTKIFLNNKPIAIKSRSGVKSLVFPQTKAEDYLIPLFIYNKNGSAMTSDEYIAAAEKKENN